MGWYKDFDDTTLKLSWANPSSGSAKADSTKVEGPVTRPVN